MDADTIPTILTICGNSFLYTATVSRAWRRAYTTINESPPKTSLGHAVASESTLCSILEALGNDDTLNNAAFYQASKIGNLYVLNLLLENKRPTGLYTPAAGAVAGGCLQSLKWASSNGFPLDNFVCHAAPSAGNLEMLQWAVETGCPWDLVLCNTVSRQNGHTNVQYWMKKY